MTDIQVMAKRLAELERVRKNLAQTGHPDDVASYQALALKYIEGTVSHDMAMTHIAAGLNSMIREAKAKLREVLK